MSWKCALLGLPFGGAKGGVRCDPSRLSAAELERVMRRYTTELAPVLGPDRDIPAPDMGTGAREMGWLFDTYSQGLGFSVPAVVTGKPVSLGGLEARQGATGLGVVHVLDAFLGHLGRSLVDQRVVVQGLGNVGRVAAAHLQGRGATVVAIADASCGLVDEGGLDICEVEAWQREHGQLAGYPGGRCVEPEDILLCECDVLIPAAVERQIKADNAGDLRCGLLVEAANGPTTPAAEAILARRGIPVIPDILANAGGVTASYFEWVQDHQRYTWDGDELAKRMETMLRATAEEVWETAARRDLDLRTAALSLAVDRVAQAGVRRGVFP